MTDYKKPLVYTIPKAGLNAYLHSSGIRIHPASVFARKEHEANNNKTDSQIDWNDKTLVQAICICAWPGIIVTMREFGAQGLQEVLLHQNAAEGKFLVLVEENDKNEYVMVKYENESHWINTWLHSFASPVMIPNANYIPPLVSMEEFLLALHAIDCYRRVSYQNMLTHTFIDTPYISVSDFLGTMAASLKSMDVRWLLPAFLTLTPGVENYNINILPEGIALLLANSFFKRSKLMNGEDILLFGEAGQVMGVEFLRSWFSSAGMQIHIVSENQTQQVEQLFIAPTMLGNHFVSIAHESADQASINHQLYTSEQLQFHVKEKIAEAIHASSRRNDTTIEQEKKLGENEKAVSFCGDCGSKVIPKAIFCANCGAKLTRQ